ncbi:MAG: ABC transporter permease [Caldilineaceae bacterium]|nr:ABC transporter permease [Caldilineaceae bacterium]
MTVQDVLSKHPTTPPPSGEPSPVLEDQLDVKSERYYYAKQWQLIWWRFQRHRLAMISLFLLALLYLIAILPEFFAPYSAQARFEKFQQSPPTKIRFFDENGQFQRPFIYPLQRELDQKTFKYIYTPDTTQPYPILFLVEGEPYKLFGRWQGNLHLFGTGMGGPPLALFGTDELGRDILSRTFYGARISLSIGFVGVLLSFFIGVLLGGISGYFGGIADEIIQRIIDFLLSIPALPFWMALAAALPRDWSVTQTYFAITVILSIIGWSGLARVVRGKLLALREEDYSLAAQAAGASQPRIIFRHLLPGFTSHLIVSLTLAIPGSILGETSLSFLGLGMQPPAVSWGVLLRDAQDMVVVAQQPWRLIPGLFVIVAVLLFNFIGDGLRDAADPYSH